MTKKERKELCKVEEALTMIVHYHNKNLTKSQYYDLDDSLDRVKGLLEKDNNKRLKKMIKDSENGVPYEEIVKKEFGVNL